ncbi:MAG: 30S ribosomal protein S6 [Candidatus Omnitrophica bacterium]|nr:30S ribosomal protein S6 [Candidatus Omnitrophota bacterium]
MEQSNQLKKYELMVIVDAHMSQDDKNAIVKDVCDTVTKAQGSIVNTQVWFEKQKLSFEIKKKTEGTYYLINFEAPKAAGASIRGELRLKETLLRYLILEVEAFASKEVVPA